MSKSAGESEVRAACIHEMFGEQVARTPEAVAVVHEGERLTYAALDARAGWVARRLAGLGVGPEVLVGVFTGRSVEMVVAVLGVLKAGGAYLPLDPKYPQERLRFMLEEAAVRVLLTQESLLAKLPATGARVVCLGSDPAPGDEDAASGAGAPLPRAASPTNLAYAIYTSGSTGRPRGVAIEHASATGLVRWAGGVFGADELEGVLASTSLCFDLSVFELFVPLCHGGRVILAENVLQLPALACANQVTLINSVPSAVTELLRAGGIPPSVRTVNLAGEPLPRWLVRELYERTSARRVLNLYGPSEDTTYSTWAEMSRDSAGKPPIGRPLTDTEAHVLDAGLRPAPAADGELYLGGRGLARGYLKGPALTAERFLPDPFSNVAGARMYRTGDVVRRSPGGELEYVGRLDEQVKVRGYRVELGEIEAALVAHPRVRGAVVTLRPAHDDGGDERCLVAYLVAEAAERAPTVGEVRGYLRGLLPEWMVPGRYAFLEKLPLTPNGKIDRKALPEPGRGRPEVASAFVAPRTPSEARVARIWADVLRLDEVGVEDDFLELGGHSLLAAQIISRLRAAFAVEVPLGALFESPTVAGLTAKVAEARLSGRPSDAEPIRPGEHLNRADLSFAQQRLWFLNHLELNRTSYNVLAPVRLAGALDVPALARALNEVVRRHETLRTTFPSEDGLPFQRVTPAAELPLPFVDLSGLDASARGAEAERLAREDAGRPFDLARGPLLRALLLRLGAREHLLLLTTHHIIFDDWSAGVLMRELGLLHQAFAAGRSSPLPEPPIQYADFAAWQRRRLDCGALDELLAYWKLQLDKAPPLLRLPTDRPCGAAPSSGGARLCRLVEGRLAEALAALSRRERVTLFMTLLAAFKSLLYRYTRQEEIIVGTAVAGRARLETEGLIGCFVNALVLRTHAGGDPTFRELLRRVRGMTLGAYAHQEMPFERLVDELRPVRDPRHSPLFQVAFGLRNATAAFSALELPGLTLTPVEFEQGEVRFDLTVWVEERADGLRVLWSYRTDLFDTETVGLMHDDFVALLRRVVEQPDVRLSQLVQECAGPKRREAPAGAEHSRRESLLCLKPAPVRFPAR